MDIKEVLYYARVQSISFTDFRNIENGVVEFPNSKPEAFLSGNASILGLYGQNGSGKSSVIMALGILKSVLTGKPLGDNFMSCIREGCDRCSLGFSFSMYSKAYDDQRHPVISNDDNVCYDVYYNFDITAVVDDSDETVSDDTSHQTKALRIENEVIRLRCVSSAGDILIPKQIMMDTRKKESDEKGIPFGNETKYAMFVGKESNATQQLRELKAVTYAKSQSFLFAPKLHKAIESKLVNEVENDSEMLAFVMQFTGDIDPSNLENQESETLRAFFEQYMKINFVYLLRSLRVFGSAYLHVIDTVTTGLTNVNRQLPLLLWNADPREGVLNLNIALQMNSPTHVPERFFNRMQVALNSVSSVLSQIIPGMSLGFRDMGVTLSSNNTEEHYFEILSRRDDVTIPLKYESDGIRRIISILSLLIAAYNEASFTIAIDEIDSGIFEYLLGEILSVMSDSLQGQLIFTSHNLRALEVLPAKYLCFTTTNPQKRFIKMASRGNSNMRDSYFRSIILDTAKEPVYKPTDRYEIEMAFYNAGQYEVAQ